MRKMRRADGHIVDRIIEQRGTGIAQTFLARGNLRRCWNKLHHAPGAGVGKCARIKFTFLTGKSENNFR